MRKFRNEQAIDDASTKNALYALFNNIDDILISDGEIRRSGPFEATFDELMQLRGRIVRRLATYNACETAFEDAKRGAKEVYLVFKDGKVWMGCC